MITGHQPGLLRRGILQDADEIHRAVQKRGLLAAAHVNAGDENHGQDDVHRRTGQGDQNALPSRFGQELVGVALAVFERVVAGHFHVAAQRQSAQAVIGVAAFVSPEARAEADGKNLDAHAKGFGNDEMSPLVHQDHDAEDNRNGNDHYQEVRHFSSLPTCCNQFKLGDRGSRGLAFDFFASHPARIGIGRQHVADRRHLDLRGPREHSLDHFRNA